MKYNEKIEEAQDKKEFLEAYDHELANFECGKDEGREEGYYNGYAEGKEEGFAAGKKLGLLETIQNMRTKGLDLKTIADYMNLTVLEIKKIISEDK